MFGYFGKLREARFNEGRRDRVEGNLPRKKDFDYLESYLNDRPGGLDAVLQYFPTMEDYMRWKLNHTNYSS